MHIRYGLQLLGKVRMNNEDPVSADMKAIQLIQNKLLRSLNGTKLKDKVSTKSLLEKFNTQSVNQLNAQVKLLEVWKALNLKDYPLKIPQQTVSSSGASTRAGVKGRPINIGKSNSTRNTSISDSIRIWNLSPSVVADSKTLYQAKNAIKSFTKTLPV